MMRSCSVSDATSIEPRRPRASSTSFVAKAAKILIRVISPEPLACTREIEEPRRGALRVRRREARLDARQDLRAVLRRKREELRDDIVELESHLYENSAACDASPLRRSSRGARSLAHVVEAPDS